MFLVAIGSFLELLVVVCSRPADPILLQHISHGALQGLIPDMVPEDQRGQASAIKSMFELLPISLWFIIIAHMVEAGKLKLAIVITGAGLLIAALVTIFLVKEQPLKEKPELLSGHR